MRTSDVEVGLRPWACAFVWTCALALVLMAAACHSVRLVSEYDEVLDRGVSDVHARITAFVLRMETESGKPEGTYEANSGFYAETHGAVASLKMRARARDKNDVTVKLLDDLDRNVESLGKLHEIGKERGLRKAVASPALESIDVNCESLVKFEIAKRRGTTTE